MTRKAGRAASDARYDAKRPGPVSVRMNERQLAWLDERREPGEGRGKAISRLAGVPKI